jgi:hypothetical protein
MCATDSAARCQVLVDLLFSRVTQVHTNIMRHYHLTLTFVAVFGVHSLAEHLGELGHGHTFDPDLRAHTRARFRRRA